MTRTRTISLLATLLASFVVASAAFGFTGAHSAHDHVTTQAISPQEFKLRSDMRKLWEDHITWTRLAVISLTTGSPDTNATVARLLRNQSDIGNAIKPYFGNAAGNELTRLLKEHIRIAADLVTAAKAGDQTKAADAQARWQANADQIAAFLNKANPVAWKLGEMRAMMRSHLRLTTQEVVARLQQRWNADVAAYDKIHRQILGMADMLSSGIATQFPARFR
jgi:hypothetical protein